MTLTPADLIVTGERWNTLIERSIRYFEANERPNMDKLLDFYQGKFITKTTGDSESQVLFASLNLTFAIVQTAMSSLVAKNPQVTAVATSPVDESQIKVTEAYTNLALKNTKYRAELTLGTFDAVVYGRGVFKTAWNVEQDMPSIRSVDIRSIFFDPTARRPEDIRWWVEARVMSEEEFQGLLKRPATPEGFGHPDPEPQEVGVYRSSARDSSPGTYPKWLMSGQTDREELKNFQPWYTIYEVYDVARKKVYHMLPGESEPLMCDDLVYCPYDILTLNPNGQDCRGLSEIALISPNQEEVNNTLTFMLNTLRTNVPKGTYDPERIEAAQLAEAQKAGLGTYSPLKDASPNNPRPALEHFPQVEFPQAAVQWLERLLTNISTVSALAQAARGQVTGARTATEIALVEGQMRNLLSSRQDKLDALTTDISQKVLFLLQKYKSKEETLQVTGQEGWVTLSPATLQGVRCRFDMVAYSPMESNRAVVQEQFTNLLQYLLNNPEIDQNQLMRALVEINDNPALRRYPIVLPPKPRQQAAGVLGEEGAAPDPSLQDPGAIAQASGVVPSSAPLPPQTQGIADMQQNSPAANSPAIPASGVPIGAPQMPA